VVTLYITMHGPLNVKSRLVLNVLLTILSSVFIRVFNVIFTKVFNDGFDINNNLYFSDMYKILQGDN
jgi:hypothetical protein